MEDMEDNLIRSKLGSLHDLPESYTPNLGSKWDLLEASLEGRDKIRQRIFLWAKMAAVLASVFLLAFLFSPRAEVKPDVQALKRLEIKQEVKAGKPVPAPETKKNLVTVAPMPGLPVTQKKAEPEPQTPELKASLPEPKKDSVPLVQSTVQPSLVAEEPPLKKKKSRYVQIDFSEPVQQATTGPPQPPVYAKGFRVGIFNSNGLSPGTQTSAPGTLLKIKL